MPDDFRFELVFHSQKSGAFRLGNALYGHSCHSGNNLCNRLLINDLAILGEGAFPLAFSCVKFVFEHVGFVAVVGCRFEVLGNRRRLFFLCDVGNFQLELLDFFWRFDVGGMRFSTGFVEGVDSLVGECAVADVSLGEFDAGMQSVVGVFYVVKFLVVVFDLFENFQGFVGSGLVDDDFLETAVERTVFFERLAVFVERCSADTLQFASRQSRLEQVGCVH